MPRTRRSPSPRRASSPTRRRRWSPTRSAAKWAALAGGDLTRAQLIALMSDGEHASEGAAALNADAVIEFAGAVCHSMPAGKGVRALKVMLDEYGVAYDGSAGRDRLCAQLLDHVSRRASTYSDFTGAETVASTHMYDDFTDVGRPAVAISPAVREAIRGARVLVGSDPTVALLAADAHVSFLDMADDPARDILVHPPVLSLTLVRLGRAMTELEAAADAAAAVGDKVGRARALGIYAFFKDIRGRLTPWLDSARLRYDTPEAQAARAAHAAADATAKAADAAKAHARFKATIQAAAASSSSSVPVPTLKRAADVAWAPKP